MELTQLKELMVAFDASGLAELEICGEGRQIKMKKTAQTENRPPRPAPEETPRPQSVPEAPENFAPQEPAAVGKMVKAPLVGIFYASAAPDQPPFIQPGDPVKKGQPLGLIEAMKMMNEIKAPADGIIKRILVNNGDLVEFDQPIAEIEEQ